MGDNFQTSVESDRATGTYDSPESRPLAHYDLELGFIHHSPEVTATVSSVWSADHDIWISS